MKTDVRITVYGVPPKKEDELVKAILDILDGSFDISIEYIKAEKTEN